MSETYIVYHYCTVETFKSILQSKVLWLCDLTDSNDEEEVIRTFVVLWERVKKRLEQTDIPKDDLDNAIQLIDQQYKTEIQTEPPYGVCFCQKEDISSQWTEYGDHTKGLSLGFDINWFIHNDGIKQQKPHPSSIQSNAIGCDTVIYHSEEFEAQMADICYKALKEQGTSAWIMCIRPTFKHYSGFVKNPTFEPEAEIRIVYYPIEGIEKDWNSIPYGYPLENQSIWILDDDDQICPCGIRGEICIGGRGVASCYLNDEERTKKQFFKHEKLGYLYRTGDLGFLSSKGYVVFLGRKDFQVKLHGYRIELGEIESCLCRCKNVSEAVAEVKEVNGVQKLFAYVTPVSVSRTSEASENDTYDNENTIRVFTADGEEKYILPSDDTNHQYPNIADMYSALNSRVMDYMIPDDIIIMERFPYTANKKVNRKQLPVVHTVQAEDEVYVAPETETEKMLTELVGEIIGNEKVSIDANLINSGIDSLKGITLNTKLRDRGIDIGLSEIYANSTIRQLGKLIDESSNHNEEMEFGEI